MTGLTPRERAPGRLDPIAATWGGLVGAIGLMIGADRDWPLRLTAAAVAFLVAGFLAGVRASERRSGHALAAVAMAYVLHAGYIAAAWLIDMIAGPSAPVLVPGGPGRWLLAVGWACLFALIGGVLANAWLRPAGRQRISA